MKRAVFLLMALFALAIAANAQGLGVGSAIENFSLPDVNGNMQTLGRLKGQNGALVIFLSTQCPVVKAYKDRINQIAAEAGEKGINFVGVNSNSTESIVAIKANAAAFGYRIPVLLDKDGTLADRFGARSAPEVYFFSGENVLLYRGAIDNDQSGTTLTQNYLIAALDASLSGMPIFKKSVMPRGCSIKRAVM
ncbi:hypothetical protein BH20ACI2_BH20ACI2_25610 [soil metagenome]